MISDNDAFSIGKNAHTAASAVPQRPTRILRVTSPNGRQGMLEYVGLISFSKSFMRAELNTLDDRCICLPSRGPDGRLLI